MPSWFAIMVSGSFDQASTGLVLVGVLWFTECLSLVSGGEAQSLCLRLLWFFWGSFDPFCISWAVMRKVSKLCLFFWSDGTSAGALGSALLVKNDCLLEVMGLWLLFVHLPKADLLWRVVGVFAVLTHLWETDRSRVFFWGRRGVCCSCTLVKGRSCGG